MKTKLMLLVCALGLCGSVGAVEVKVIQSDWGSSVSIIKIDGHECIWVSEVHAVGLSCWEIKK